MRVTRRGFIGRRAVRARAQRDADVAVYVSGDQVAPTYAPGGVSTRGQYHEEPTSPSIVGGEARERTPDQPLTNTREARSRASFLLGVNMQSSASVRPARYPLSVGLGYRGRVFGGTIEGDLVSTRSTTHVLGLRGHARLYLPLGDSFEIYPLLGLSRFRGEEWDTSALDIGGGLDARLSRRLSISVRYYQSLLTDPIPVAGDEWVEAHEVMSFQLTAHL